MEYSPPKAHRALVTPTMHGKGKQRSLNGRFGALRRLGAISATDRLWHDPALRFDTLDVRFDAHLRFAVARRDWPQLYCGQPRSFASHAAMVVEIRLQDL